MRVSKRKGPLSLILVPAGGGKPRTIVLAGRRMWLLFVVAAVILGVVGFSVVTLGQKGWAALTISQLKRENMELREEHGKVARLEQELRRLKAVEKKVAAMLGIDVKGTGDEPAQAKAGETGARSQAAGEISRAGTGYMVLGSGLPGVVGASASSYTKSQPTFWPVVGEISQDFSYSREGHKGIDIAVQAGTPVRAAGDGSVEFAGLDGVFGQMVIVNHGAGISSLYGHNATLAVTRGEEVLRGSVIAYSGTSGRSTAPHLHFEISRYGKQVNPLTFLSER
jgi:murein DD-endopeptidase MepM/ murein hydrolase activator NlpD